MDLLERVLTIEEVKQRMKDIRTAAVHYDAVVHCGERGRDELVILSTKVWAEVMRQAEVPSAGSAADPYAAFSRALEEGRLGVPGVPAEARRRMPNLVDHSGLTPEQMIAMAGPDPSPRRRRSH